MRYVMHSHSNLGQLGIYHGAKIMLVMIALVLSSVAALSGILAVGNGRCWNFEIRDYFRGKRNAILYLWVVTSTIFSMLHSGMLVNYGIVYHWQYRNHDTHIWMALHAAMGLLLTMAHIFVSYTLAKEVGPTDKYLWGSKCRAGSELYRR
jgi:phosphatidylglycerophosphate synthase